MTIEAAERLVNNSILHMYDEAEAKQIAALVLEKVTGLTQGERRRYKETQLNGTQSELLAGWHNRLIQNEPVQYILNEAWFYDFPLYVDSNVLIPRPETAELAEWIINDVRNSGKHVFKKDTADADRTNELKILDVGTGSGCIALALKKKLPLAEVWGCDNSDGALNIARRNASELDIRVDFVGVDFLSEPQRKQLPMVNIIVSNPPYIPLREKDTIAPNVLLYEPHTALFVPDQDPLIFYRAIAHFGHRQLFNGGAIYLEIHEGLGTEAAELLSREGYQTVIKKDMQGKERMIKAVKDQNKKR